MKTETRTEFEGHRRRRSLPARPSFALFYDTDSFDHGNGPIIGRRSMGVGLLDALYRHLPEGGFAVMPSRPECLNDFFRDAASRGVKGASVAILRPGDMAGLEAAGVAYLPMPNVDDLAFARRTTRRTAFSVVGLTHSLSTMRIYHLVFRLLFAPLQPWDALICTSRAAKQAVCGVIDSHFDYLRSRGVSAPAPPFQLPVIPLGVHCDQFDRTAERIAAAREWRQSHGIEDDDVVLLNFGRVDPLTKSHPLPLVLAMETAQRNLGNAQRLHLVIAGTPADPNMAKELLTLVEEYSPSFTVHWVDGLVEGETKHVWVAADIFISLSDNVQETFGLTPIEAMAASLPCIVSDWSGYRDTVVHMETGILVPTYLPHHDSGLGIYFGDRHEQNLDPYPAYVGGLSQATSVDIEACAAGIEYLVKNPDERRRMGGNGRHRAKTTYDWSIVLSQYSELFDELRTMREASVDSVSDDPARGCLHPFNPDPLKVFSGFSNNVVDGNTTIHPVQQPHVDIKWLLDRSVTSFSRDAMLKQEQIIEMISMIKSANGCTISEVYDYYTDVEESRIFATCLWLSKYGLAKFHFEDVNRQR